MNTEDRFYVTTFCNWAHRVKDGKPIGHECLVLNPKVLACEANQGAEAALAYMRDNGEPLHLGEMHRGLKGVA